MFRAIIVLCVLFIFFIVSISNAAVIYVDVNGPNEPGTGTFYDPFRRIQDAIDDANAGDIVEIRPGIYIAHPNNYNLDPNGLAITIRSIDPNDPNIIANTIIDPNKAGRGFRIYSGEDSNCVISGLTIRNGYAAGDSGGGIYCSDSNPTISHCIITNNAADLYGGGIYCYYSSSQIIGCTISGNQAIDGGGLECGGGVPEITNCIIANNQVSGFGGGVDCYGSCDAVLTNCTVVANSSANFGGGLCFALGDVSIKNSILWANDAAQGPEIALIPHPLGASTVTVSYSDVQGGRTVVHDPCEGLVWGSDNIDADPCFASFDPNTDPNLWDFHLQSAYGRWDSNSRSWKADPNTSPCLDAGDPNADWDGEIWPNGKRINMGAYGGTTQASMNGNRADFNIDGVVDFVDFAEFSKQWMAEEACIEDLTGNGVVDFADAAIFAENWLWHRE